MMSRRRVLLISLSLFVSIVVVGFFLWNYPGLSSTERQLLGKWMTPAPNPRVGHITSKGPVTHPELVLEFRRDRSFRVWVVSADDPEISILNQEGLWRASGEKLRLEGFSATGSRVREIREQLRIRLGGTYVGRTSGPVSHPIRFSARDTLELTTPDGKSILWKRRP